MALRKSMWYHSALSVSPLINFAGACKQRRKSIHMPLSAFKFGLPPTFLFDSSPRRSKRGARRSAKRIAGEHSGWIKYGYEDLSLGSIQFGKGWSVISFIIRTAQGQRRIDGLPAKRRTWAFPWNPNR